MKPWLVIQDIVILAVNIVTNHLVPSMTMRTIHYIASWMTLMCTILFLTSCDPVSSVDYKIYNKTADTVTIDMYKEILSSSYQGFDIVKNDSVTTHYGEQDTVSVAVLAPDMVLTVKREWSGLYREEWVVPVWKYIRSIIAGKTELPSTAWEDEAVWSLRTDGGGRFEGESRHYTLILRNK